MTATTIFTIPAGETFQSFAQLNNILIVITDLNRYFLLYDVDTGTYSELEEIPMPLMDFKKNIIYTNLKSDIYQAGTYTGNSNPSTAIEFQDAVDIHVVVKELLNTLINTYKSNNVIRGMVLLRFAYKLFDGSYIKHSMPFYVNVRDETSNSDLTNVMKLVPELNAGDSTWDWHWEDISLGNIQYAYKFTTEQANILDTYKGIIQSLDIFMTEPIIDRNIEETFCKQDITNTYEWILNDNWTGYFGYIPGENTKGAKDLREKYLYYKILSIDLNTLIKTPESSSLTEITLNDLPLFNTLELLPVDNFTHHNIWGNRNYIYNSRLHFGDVKTKFYDGYFPFRWEFGYTDQSTQTYRIKTYIRTESGDKIVYNIIETPFMVEYYSTLLADDVIALNLPVMISYPDSRAYKMEIQRLDGGDYYTQTGAFFSEINLISHPFLNLSYMDAFYNPHPDGLYLFTIESHYTGVDNYIQLDVADTDVENDLLNDPNRVQVSRLDNALVYEAVNSYQVGNDDETIIGFGSVVEPLSDGQFGQFPLYIFTTAGNFVLSQGTGAILYSNILPLNKDVCNNPLSITDIGGGVVYSTEKGLMILSGRQITEISQFLKGDPREYLINDTTYQDYLNDQNFVQLLSDLSTVNFLTYLSGAIIGFDYVNKEIIVSNDTYTFSYVYNIESKSWHKITEVYSEFVKVIPKTYGYSSGILYDLTDEDYDYIETLIQTRPIKLDTLNHKSIERLVLRGYYDVKDLTYSALLIYGSVDGKSYKFLTGRSRQDDSTFQDILVKNTHSSFKYFILVFVGQLKDSSINFIEVSYSERFGNKLR